MATFLSGRISTIKYHGIFDLEGLYTLIDSWLKDREFEVHNKVFKHKKSGQGYENEGTIIGERKETEYILYKIEVDFKMIDLKTVEVVKDGKKQKMQSAIIRIFFDFAVEFDYTGTFDRSPFYSKLRNFFMHRVLKSELFTKHADKLQYMTIRLQTNVKKHLGMETGSSAYP